MAKGKSRPNYDVKLRPGETGLFPRLHTPELTLNGAGRYAYLWVGGVDGGGCVGTLSGPVALRKLAKEILDRVGER